MANLKKVKLPDDITYNINDERIPDLTTSTAGQILKVNSSKTAFEFADQSGATITIRRWEDENS